MNSLLSRLVILVTFFANCSPDLPAIEKRLKEDKSRPGKVGTLRALETIHKASSITSTPCNPIIDADFRGRFSSELSIELSRRNGENFRRLHEKRTLEINDKITKISTEKGTVDELGIEHQSKRSWYFDGENTLIKTSIGHGETIGPRRPRSDEKEKIILAATSSFRAFRAFVEPKCSSQENENLEKSLSEITLDKNEISENKATLNWRAISEGRQIKVKYNHERVEENIELTMPKADGELGLQTSGFSSAQNLINELRTEKLIK